jgi:hypothetical protein
MALIMDADETSLVVVLNDTHVTPRPFMDPILGTHIWEWLFENEVKFEFGEVYNGDKFDSDKVSGPIMRPALIFENIADATWFKMRWI